jgi:hypothetical protein
MGLDAVCINQANLAEREFQIAAMRSVYASASRILVWLGLASEASSRRPPLQSTPLLILNALHFPPCPRQTLLLAHSHPVLLQRTSILSTSLSPQLFLHALREAANGL